MTDHDRDPDADLDADVRQVIDAALGRGEGAGDPDPALVARSWTHVHEEDHGELQVYRPSGADLPPARGRTTLDLSPDGALRRRTPGPDDRSVVRGGTWELRGRRLMIRPEDGLPLDFDIELLEPDRLLVRRVSHTEEGASHG